MSQDATIQPAQRGHEITRVTRPMYARCWLLEPAPRYTIPEDGMPPSTAYHLIHDELILDGTSRFNLATFAERGWSRKPCASWPRRSTRT
jgi:glutamate decarboxylase